MRNTIIAVGKDIIKCLEDNNEVKAYEILYSCDTIKDDEFNLLSFAILKWSDFINGKILCSDMEYIKTSYAPCYISRKEGAVEKLYIGKYGVGVTIHTPAFNTSKYHIISYYIF